MLVSFYRWCHCDAVSGDTKNVLLSFNKFWQVLIVSEDIERHRPNPTEISLFCLAWFFVLLLPARKCDNHTNKHAIGSLSSFHRDPLLIAYFHFPIGGFLLLRSFQNHALSDFQRNRCVGDDDDCEWNDKLKEHQSSSIDFSLTLIGSPVLRAIKTTEILKLSEALFEHNRWCDSCSKTAN